MLRRKGLSPYAAAKAMHKQSFQPTLHKFLHGQIAVPTRGTAKRIADFLAIPIEAIYDPAVSSRIAQEQRLTGEVYPEPMPASPLNSNEPVPIYEVRRQQQLSVEITSRISELNAKQFKALEQLVLVYLDSIAPAPESDSGKRLQG